MLPFRALSLMILAAALLAACGKSDEPRQAAIQAPPVKQTAEGTPAPERKEAPSGIIKRPAAKATPEEWRKIQTFTKKAWALTTRQSKAYDTMRRKQGSALSQGNVGAIGMAMVQYRDALWAISTDLDALEAPDVSDEHTQHYMEQALMHYTLAIQAEDSKIKNLIGEMAGGREVPAGESDSATHEANGHAALMVAYLNRIYWNYGYDSNDIDGRTFTPKKGAKPAATVEFNDS